MRHDSVKDAQQCHALVLYLLLASNTCPTTYANNGQTTTLAELNRWITTSSCQFCQLRSDQEPVHLLIHSKAETYYLLCPHSLQQDLVGVRYQSSH
ncbi:hypothetical protein M758_UG342900 [Ceratodon purpureus]|nr:hypothetical protein M758_UG342900 [Ceratodon purpureus]